MGIDLYGGEGADLYTRRAGYLLVRWLDEHDTRDFTAANWVDQIGSHDYPADCVERADKAIPHEYVAPAKVGDYDEDDYRMARDFLKIAALNGSGVTGSS